LEVLLVGGLGFIGKHIIRRLDQCNLSVLSDVRGASDNAAFVKRCGLKVEVCDIRDGGQVREVMLRQRPEAVVHLAALTGIERCNVDPSLAFSVNVLGTYNVVMGCAACRARLIFISSREVYGETTFEKAREEDPLVPNNVYGITKLLGERLVAWAATKHNLDHVILRLTNVYGPGGDQYGVQKIIKEALSKGRIKILGGSQQMDFIYVEDVAEVVRRCLDDPRVSGQVFNVGSGEAISVEEMASKLVSLLDTSIQINRGPMREGETLRFVPSLERLDKALGYLPSTTLLTGLRKTIDWYRSGSTISYTNAEK